MTFQSDAGLFAHTIDLAGDRVLLVTMREQDYREASFLDNRLLQATPGKPTPAMQWAQWDQLEAASVNIRDDAQFIFHIGHVGSTLISRLLGEGHRTLALREPQLLRQFAEISALEGLPHSPWRPGMLDTRLALARTWLSRTFSTDQRALVKATSFVSDIAPHILKTQRKALFLMLSPVRYIQTILAGEASRQELAALSATRLQRLNMRLTAESGGPAINLWELDEAKRAAMAWACEMTALEAAQDGSVFWVNFDSFLKEPATSLCQIAQFLDVGLSANACEHLTSGPIMQQYSKAPEHGYSSELREEVLQDAARARSEDISAAMGWLENQAKVHPAIAAALERA